MGPHVTSVARARFVPLCVGHVVSSRTIYKPGGIMYTFTYLKLWCQFSVTVLAAFKSFRKIDKFHVCSLPQKPKMIRISMGQPVQKVTLSMEFLVHKMMDVKFFQEIWTME